METIVRAVGVVLCVALIGAAMPLTGFAEPVNKAIASDSAAVLAKIEAMNLPDMPKEVAVELRGEGLYVLYGYFSQLANWCIAWCQPLYEYIDAFLTTADIVYASLPRGTPVYTGTAQSTPAYYKK